MVVRSREDRGATRCTDRVGAEAIVEAHASVGDTIEVGGLVDSAAVTTHGVGGMVVGHDKEDVGAVGGHSYLLLSFAGVDIVYPASIAERRRSGIVDRMVRVRLILLLLSYSSRLVTCPPAQAMEWVVHYSPFGLCREC